MIAPPLRSRAAGAALLGLQLAAGLFASGAVALLGGGRDATLLVPLSPAAAAALPGLVLDGRTALLGTGLLPGSLLVRRSAGRHAATWRAGIVAIRVPARLCAGAGTA